MCLEYGGHSDYDNVALNVRRRADELDGRRLVSIVGVTKPKLRAESRPVCELPVFNDNGTETSNERNQ